MLTSKEGVENLFDGAKGRTPHDNCYQPERLRYTTLLTQVCLKIEFFLYSLDFFALKL